MRTLIPKTAEGINNVICKFNETYEYVLYYHGGRKTLRVFKMSDGSMIANYRVPSALTSIESTTDGNNVVLGMVDGSISTLTIADLDHPKRRMSKYLQSLPSRYGLQQLLTKQAPNFTMLIKSRAKLDSCVDTFKSNIDKD